MCLSGGACLCEKLFSTTNLNTCGSRLTDAHLKAVLRVSTVISIRENVAQLCEQRRCQVSAKKIKFKSVQGFHLLAQCEVYFK